MLHWRARGFCGGLMLHAVIVVSDEGRSVGFRARVPHAAVARLVPADSVPVGRLDRGAHRRTDLLAQVFDGAWALQMGAAPGGWGPLQIRREFPSRAG